MDPYVRPVQPLATAQIDGSGARDVRSRMSPVSLTIGEVSSLDRSGCLSCSNTWARFHSWDLDGSGQQPTVTAQCELD